ncbi:MAG: hypothetical protein JOZ07_16950 [Solirubrobacterales bacterium]|nr:hypothetical protein [Solirubrobacterales bacterium]
MADLDIDPAPAWALDGAGAQCLAVDPGDAETVYVGCRGGGLVRTRDGGESWEELDLPERDVFSVAVSPADGAVYAGTEPSRLFRSRDGVSRFEELTALQDIPSRPRWSFPPRPWTSHVRWIAPDPHDGARLLVGIELGGLMCSEDDGATFTDHRPGAQPDVHALAWHPSVAGRAYEAAGGGAAWSRDGGASWRAADEGRELHYVWALAVDPADPDRWFVSAAPGPGRAHGGERADAALYCWQGEGPWRRLTPEPLSALPYALSATAGGQLVAGLGDGRILRSRDGGDSWELAPVRADAILALSALEAA